MAEKKRIRTTREDSIEEIQAAYAESEEANLTTDSHRLTTWERVKLARHKDRPYTLDYIELLFTDFVGDSRRPAVWR